MARSSYVYIVCKTADPTSAREPGSDIIAAFTVKHEMLSWIRSEKYEPKYLIVWRLSDGDRRERVRMDIDIS
jgi:hypothetical protein